MVIQEEALRSRGKDLKLVKAKICLYGNYAQLEMNPEEFFDFCRQNAVKIVLFEYSFYDKLNYIITDDLLMKQTDNQKEFDFCKNWAKGRNAELEKFDFSMPRSLNIIAAFEGLTIVCHQEDNWLPERFENAKLALDTFQDSHEEEFLDMYEPDEESDDLIDELRNTLLSDSNFRYSTNKESRRVYFNAFIRKEENKKFLKLVGNEKRKIDKQLRMGTIIDQIYNEYRNACYRTKIQIGEALPKENELC